MKKLLILLVLAITAWISYQYSQGTFRLKGDWPPSSFSSSSSKSPSSGARMALSIEKGEGKEGEEDEQVPIAELFHRELKPYQDHVFSGLSAKSGKGPSIGKVMAAASMELKTRGGDRQAARLALEISRSLQKAAKTRNGYEQELAKLQSTTFRSLNNRDTSKKKKFFEDAIKRRWDEYVEERRPRIDRMMGQLSVLK